MRCTLCASDIDRRPDGTWVDGEGRAQCRLSRSGQHHPDEWDEGGNILFAPAYMATEV